MPRPRVKRPSSSLEREVIGAVVILYLLISGAMFAIHSLQPAGRETKSSSTSPSHESLSTNRPEGSAPSK
jgi:hypothetical protein